MLSVQFKRAHFGYETMTPERAETYHSRGVALGEMGDLRAAMDMFEQAVRIRPDYAKAWNNLGVALKGLGDVDSAIQKFRRAIQIDPDYVEAHWNLSFLLLLTGAFPEGWKEYEWRFRKREWQRNVRAFDGVPRWHGEPFRGKRLLICDEQGFGDALQFVRYLKRVKEMGGTVVLETQSPLMSLFRSVSGVDRLTEKPTDVRNDGAFDCYVPLLSLPAVFETTIETIPSQGLVPYIHAAPEKVACWRKRLNGIGFKIGLVWQGKLIDPNRACPVERLASLSLMEGVKLYGLQKGGPARQLVHLPGEMTIANLGNQLHDFSDTAAVMENLDLIISVDTAAVHLAGAMGRPTCALLPFAPDWRWLLNREDSPWYPTMRLFRQTARGDWDDALRSLFTKVREMTLKGSWASTLPVASQPGKNAATPGAMSMDGKGPVSEAIRLHQSGRIEKAQEICEQVLQQVPGCRDALHLLSIIYHQTGRPERIAALVENAVRHNLKGSSLFLSLGNLLMALGHGEEALTCYQEAVRQRPESAEARYNMGNVLKEQGDLTAAILSYVEAIDLKDDMFDAYYNMGNAFHQLGELHKALTCYRKTLAIRPEHIEARHNAGLTLKDLGRFEDAVACYQKALQFKPQAAELHYNLGNVYKEAGRFDDAVSSYGKAIDLKHDMVDAHYNMANALKESGALREAISCYEQVLNMAPDHADALNNMGLAYRDLGQVDHAIDLFDQALKLSPGHVEIRWNRSLALLLRGDLVEGWKEYEVRFQRNDLGTTYPRRFDKPIWDGSSFKGKRLLVHHEQGLGDTIQFVRYLPMVKARGGTVILEVHAPLRHLCRGLEGADQVISPPLDQDLDLAFDSYIPLLSLPKIFGTTMDTIPAHIPYLRADSEIRDLWQDQLDGSPPAIGLVWAGNPEHKDDRNRSCALRLFEPLGRIPGIRLFGMQKHGWKQSEGLLQAMGIMNLGKALKDFSVTAGIIKALDLVISVDTAVAHLAGAMGKPVWLLLPFIPDWRWLMERDDSPWYPTMRLFRQKRPGDWQEVIRRVAAELRTMVAARSGEMPRCRQGEGVFKDPPPFVRTRLTATRMAEALQYHRSGKWRKAKEICQQVIEEDPENPEALHLKGIISHAEGRYREAGHLIRKAIDMDPQPLFFNNLGAAYQEKGDLEEALLCYRKAIQLRPEFAEACNNLGKALVKLKQFEEAVAWFEKTVDLRPEFAEPYTGMAKAFMELGRPDRAVACGRQLLQMDPGNADAHFMIGNGLKEQDQFHAAISSYRKALTRNPTHVQALVHMGLAYQFLGRIGRAIEVFDQALIIDKTHPGANLNRALAHLLSGNYAEGWKGYEWRLKMEDWKQRRTRTIDRPRWDGSSFKDKTVLVYHEQGLGDELQFVRFLPMVAARGGTVIYESNKRLLRLFRGLHGVKEWVLLASGQCSESETSFQVPLLSLPGLFKATLETIPSETPYLQPERELVDQWSHRLRDIPGYRIGISWQGNPAYRDDRHRSVPLAHFLSLARIHGVVLVSLQKGHGIDQMERLPHGLPIVNLGLELDNGTDAFVDTAAVMANLDLIVTSDTAIPHLAGALGIPVWLVLPHIPDWRWGISGETSPWYPGMRLFRQVKQRDWSGVFQRVCHAMKDRPGTRLRSARGGP